MPEINKKTVRRIIWIALAISCGSILLYWLLNNEVRVKRVFDSIKSVFNPFVLGAAMAFVLNVPMRAFEKLFKFIAKHFIKHHLRI